jgi:hypothetical protein
MPLRLADLGPKPPGQRDRGELVGGGSSERPGLQLGDERAELRALSRSEATATTDELEQTPAIRGRESLQVPAREECDLRDREDSEEGELTGHTAGEQASEHHGRPTRDRRRRCDATRHAQPLSGERHPGRVKAR